MTFDFGTIDVVQPVIAAVLSILVMMWLGYTRDSTRLPPGALRYPLGVLAIGLAAFAFGAAASVLSYGHPTGGPLVASVFVAMALGGAYLIAEFWITRFRATDSGLEYRTLLRGRGAVSWGQVLTVRYEPSLTWFALRLDPPKTLHLSVMLSGWPAFAALLLQRAGGIEPMAEAQLRAMAMGHMPTV